MPHRSPRHRSACALALLTALVAAFTHTANAAEDARVIVRYRADSLLLRKQAPSLTAQQLQRVQLLGQRVALTLRAGASVAERVEVVHAAGMSSEQLAARLTQDADVEYAVPDRLQQHYSAPNDARYIAGPTVNAGTGGPASGQWYLRAPTADVKSSIDVEGAWDVSYGLPDIVVAVIDTGVVFDHPDLARTSQSGNLLPGYDMISETTISGDGNGRDVDASDPGDFLTMAEASARCGFPCAGSDSSWHGTQTSGLIAALTDNSIGMASVGRHVRVLPVRVLGKGGGFDSDIIAGMRWASGLFVAGVPANSTPARVLNISLGSFNTCSLAYADAISEINAAGVVVVASAGNSAGHAVATPANCPGVIAVAALRHAGSKVGFSDIGAEIAISAPGGNCVNIGPGDACLFPILTSSNSGSTAPVAASAGGAIFTDSFNPSFGTSFSAPIVAGTAALLLSAKPSLTPTQVRTLLRQTARAFPTTGAEDPFQAVIPFCAVPAPIGFPQTDQLQCYCTTSTCGAGMLDAGAAMRALSGLRARITATSNVRAGQAVTLSAASSILPAGRSITSYAWRLPDASGNFSFAGATNGSTVAGTPAQAGTFRIGLTVVDNTGLRASTETLFTATAVASSVLDIDDNGSVTALTDGVLLLRQLFGFTGAALTTGALDPGALRTDPQTIANYVNSVRAQLDVDGNGATDALTDGVLILRFLFGFDGDALLGGAIGAAATRTSAAAVRGYLQGLSN